MTSQILDLVRRFKVLCERNPDKSEAVVAIEVLAQLHECSDVTTVQGLHDVMNAAIERMWKEGVSNLSVISACELFQRFITLATLDTVDFDECKRVLFERAQIFIRKVGSCRRKIAENFLNYIPNGSVIFLHSYSRVVLAALEYAASTQKRLHCYVTTCAPSGLGAKMTKALAKLKVSCTLVPDNSLAYLMPQVDLVVLGAEAVVESGGILNMLGSSLMAMTASSFGRPVYVLAESFKFMRCYPLDQRHIPDEFKWSYDHECGSLSPSALLILGDGNNYLTQDENNCDFPEMKTAWADVEAQRVPVIEQKMPRVDYTSPCYINYLITDLGVLTPSAVSDELIKLYL
uniref:Translation initiation factor eIF2B subunit alpha n=1 Tax=Schistosoma mansoni TaxID=6183 RepID=A0A3Q0KIJ4_SCHMA